MLTVTAPDGSHFEFEPVKTKGGTQVLGDVPILVWDDAKAATDFYGEAGIIDILDGTSLRVSFQSIARRKKIADKTDDDIAKAEIDFRPGKRVIGASTPQSRTASAAKRAVEKNPAAADVLASLLAKIEAGEIGVDELELLAK